MATAHAGKLAIPGHRVGFPRITKTISKLLTRGVIVFSIVVAAGVFGSTVVPSMFGYKTMVVTSGSMEPTIGVGAAAIVKPVKGSEVAIGDIITFRSPGSTGMTTHRVIDSKVINGILYYRTQGDANESPDADLTPADAVYARVFVSIPRAGYLLAYVSTVWGRLLSIGLPMLILVVGEFRGLFGLRRSQAVREKKRRAREAVASGQAQRPDARTSVALKEQIKESTPPEPETMDREETPRYEIDEGQRLKVVSSFTHQGWKHTHKAQIDWGDGIVRTADMPETGPKGLFLAEHTYARSGVFRITVEVTDDVGGVGTDTALVNVRSLPPVVKIEGIGVVGGRAVPSGESQEHGPGDQATTPARAQ